MSKKNKLHIYIHFPFCTEKCFYCDFFSIVSGDRQACIEAIQMDLAAETEKFRSLDMGSIYIGGGTPSLLDIGDLARLIQAAGGGANLHDCEISMEMNPAANQEEGLRERLTACRDLGINRLSIGIQSFSDIDLKNMGRIHSVRDAVNTFHAVRQSGFENINIDLMFGLPAMSLDRFSKTIDIALALSPDHISAYCLSIPEGSELQRRIAARLLPPPDEDAARRQYDELQTRLADRYIHYEISNWARPGQECRHNMNTWQYGQYAGVGPSACGFFGNRRYRKTANVSLYSERIAAGGDGVEWEERLSAIESCREAFMLGLRTRAGVDLDELNAGFDINFDERYAKQIEAGCQGTFLRFSGRQLSIVPEYYFVSSAIIREFF